MTLLRLAQAIQAGIDAAGPEQPSDAELRRLRAEREADQARARIAEFKAVRELRALYGAPTDA